jgi:hypothetical protein
MTLSEYLKTTNISSRPEEFRLFDCNGFKIEMKYLKYFFQSEVSEAKVSDDKRHIDVTISDEFLIFGLHAIKEEEGESALRFFLVDSFYRPCITRKDYGDFVADFYHKLNVDGSDYSFISCDKQILELLDRLK